MERFTLNVITFAINYVAALIFTSTISICIGILFIIGFALTGETGLIHLLEKLKIFSFIDSGFGSGNFGMSELVKLYAFLALCFSIIVSSFKHALELILKKPLHISARQQMLMYMLPVTILHIAGGICMTLIKFNNKAEMLIPLPMFSFLLFFGFWIASTIGIVLSFGIKRIFVKLVSSHSLQQSLKS